MPKTTLMPLPKQQYFSALGTPLVGGKVYTYAAGTTSPKATYTDAAGTIPQPNPIPLNLRGEPANPIFWSGNYRVDLRDALGNLIYTVDNYNTDPAGLLNILIQLASSVGSSLIGFMQAGAGAVLRTLQDKARESVSIADFGASSAKTIAQNTAAAQKAIDSLAAGGEVLFPNQDWQLDTLYITNDRVRLRGIGDATIYWSGNNDGIVAGVTGSALTFLEIVDLRFDRIAKSTSGAAVKMVNTVYSKVENCKFKNSYIGIDVVQHNDSLKIVGNHFYDGTFYGVHEYNQGVTWANDLTIRGNFFWHVEDSGVFLGADGVGVASIGDTYIDENVFVSSISKGALQTKKAINAVGAGTYNTNVSVRGNVFEGIKQQSVFMTGLSRCRISNNYFSGTDTNDVGLYFGGGVGNSTIHDNIFVGYNNPAAYIYSTGGISIQGNHFTSNSTLGGANPELSMMNVNDVLVDANYFYSSSSRYAIETTQSGASVDNITYTNNRFSKASGNTNYVYDIHHNNFGGAKLMRGNIGNDATSGAALSPPVAGMALQWYPGDKIENKSASEVGTAGSKYIVTGWVNIAQGDPGIFREMRVLTGN